MFKLKPGNVFQKINKMDKKQAYTWGAIIVVCFIALMTLASFMGNAEDASFDGFNTRGYDLAQMPFVNDEAEEYLLASKYPDMQNNGSTMLYSQAEKEARQEADAEAAAESAAETDSDSSEEYNTTNIYKSKGYTGRGRGAGAGTPTQVGTLGSASMGHASGSGMSGTFGAPRGDFSPYNSQEKGSEIQTQLRNTDAKKALSQFARTSRAAAGLKDGKGVNAKRALMGGSIKGSEAFTETGVDLSKAGGLALDTNAPVSSADLSDLDKKVSDGAKDAKNDKDDFNNDLQESFLDQLLQQLVSGVIDTLNSAANQWLSGQIDQWQANSQGNSAFNDKINATSDALYGKPYDKLTGDEIKQLESMGVSVPLGPCPDTGCKTVGDLWKGQNNGKGNQKGFRNANKNYYNKHTDSDVWQAANEARQDARSAHLGRSSSSYSNGCKKSCESIPNKESQAYGTCMSKC